MSGWLKLSIVKGRNLVATDTSGLSDPFVRVSLDGASAPMTTVDGGKVVTDVNLQTLNPSWNKEYLTKATKKCGALQFTVWDSARLGKDTFMGEFVVDVGVGTERGSAGEAWLPLGPRKGNAADEELFQKKKNDFGEIYVKWFWTYSTIGQLLCHEDINKEEDVPLEDFETGKLTKEITRVSNMAYYLCLPWFWIDEKFRWENPFDSLLVLCITTYVCVEDLLAEIFVFIVFALMLKWLAHRVQYGYYGEPIPAVPVKAYPDPFAWMRDYGNMTMQLQITQNSCAMVSDLCDWVTQVLTWERQDSAWALTQAFAGWTVVAYLGYAPPFRYILLAAFWYMFTYYPLMFYYPKLYKVVEPAALIARLTGGCADAGADAGAAGAGGAGGSCCALACAEPEEAPAPVAAEKEGEVHPCLTEALRIFTHKEGWVTVSQGEGVLYEKAHAAWCPTVLVRVSGVMKVPVQKFATFITDTETAKLYDPLLDKVKELEEYADGSRAVYTCFKAPVMFITARDFVSQMSSSLVHPDNFAKHGLKCPEFCAAVPKDLKDFHNEAGVFVTGGRVMTHAKGTPTKEYVRGKIHGFGWVAEPLTESSTKITFNMATDPGGMIPAKVAEKANSVQAQKFKTIKKILEGREKSGK